MIILTIFCSVADYSNLSRYWGWTLRELVSFIHPIRIHDLVVVAVVIVLKCMFVN